MKKAKLTQYKIARNDIKAALAFPTDECIRWRFTKAPNGYGMVYNVPTKKCIGVHRLAVQIAQGKPVPKGMLAVHKCRNRDCYNPSHLSVSTHMGNAADAVRDKTAPRYFAMLDTNTSGYRGVSYVKSRKKWRARIALTNQDLYLGAYDIKEHAAIARDVASILLFGSDCYLNFPREWYIKENQA